MISEGTGEGTGARLGQPTAREPNGARTRREAQARRGVRNYPVPADGFRAETERHDPDDLPPDARGSLVPL
jgi:hypothetical protein